MRNIQPVLVPVRFKLRISFSPLHADDHHPIENKEACNRHCPVSKKNHNGKCQVYLVSIIKELGTDTFTSLHSCLQGKLVHFSCAQCWYFNNFVRIMNIIISTGKISSFLGWIAWQDAQTEYNLTQRKLRLNVICFRGSSDWMWFDSEEAQTESDLTQAKLRLNVIWLRGSSDWMWFDSKN